MVRAQSNEPQIKCVSHGGTSQQLQRNGFITDQYLNISSCTAKLQHSRVPKDNAFSCFVIQTLFLIDINH